MLQYLFKANVVNKIWRSSTVRFNHESNSATKYKISNILGKGRIAIAVDYVKAGTEICRQLPLLQIPSNAVDVENVRSYSKLTKIQPELVAMLWQFQNLQQLEKDQILTLYCPIVGKKANSVNTVAESWINISPDIKSLIIRIATIMSFSSYVNEQGSRVLYHLTSLMSHSCVPNCIVDTASVEMTVRCITAVEKDEELTIEYNEDYFDQPTHVRRAHLIQSKEFLCRCPRCESIAGDDTRQFNCFDSACNGRHLATQSTTETNSETIHQLHHYLLPCTQCGRPPPPAYEALMFQKESSFHREVQQLRDNMQVALTQPASQQQSDTFYRYHFFTYFSTCHSMCVEFAMEQAEFYRTTGGDAARSNRLNEMALTCLDSCVRVPHFYTANLCSRLGDHHASYHHHDDGAAAAAAAGEEEEEEEEEDNDEDDDDGGDKDSPSLAGLQRAREYYERALRICEIEQRRECLALQQSLTKKLVAVVRVIDAKSTSE